jgi:hypothetical protein
MPQYVVDELLAAEGITQVDYVVTDSGPLLSKAIASGQIDFSMHFSGPLVLLLDRGGKVTMLAGVHVGCFELFAKNGMRSIADLKGRSVGISALESSPHIFVSADGGAGWARSDQGHQLGDERGAALRFREAGMIKSSPDRIIAEGADWRASCARSGGSSGDHAGHCAAGRALTPPVTEKRLRPASISIDLDSRKGGEGYFALAIE